MWDVMAVYHTPEVSPDLGEVPAQRLGIGHGRLPCARPTTDRCKRLTERIANRSRDPSYAL